MKAFTTKQFGIGLGAWLRNEIRNPGSVFEFCSRDILLCHKPLTDDGLSPPPRWGRFF